MMEHFRSQSKSKRGLSKITHWLAIKQRRIWRSQICKWRKIMKWSTLGSTIEDFSIFNRIYLGLWTNKPRKECKDSMIWSLRVLRKIAMIDLPRLKSSENESNQKLNRKIKVCNSARHNLWIWIQCRTPQNQRSQSQTPPEIKSNFCPKEINNLKTIKSKKL